MTIRIDGTNTAANPGITGTDTDTGLQFGTDEVNIVTGGSKRATVDSNGNLGIGTASIDSNTNYNTLEIVGDTSSGGGIVRLKTGDRTTAKTMLFCDTGGFEARVETNHPFVISTNNSERLRVLAGGGLTFNGDTAAANALDDYDEGTWTPTDASGGSQNALTASGRYTKIGNLLFCTFDVTYPNTADTAVAAVSLPFSAGPTNLQGAGALAWQNHGSLMTIYMGSSSNSFSFRDPTDTSQAGIRNNALSGQRLIGSITVRTT